MHKKEFIYFLISRLSLLVGGFILGYTIELNFIHILAMILIFTGGYLTNRNS